MMDDQRAGSIANNSKTSTTDLVLSLYNTGMQDNAQGLTNSWCDGNVWETRIALSANMVWPLLVPQFSNSEKVSASFWIAGTLLHELCVCGYSPPSPSFSAPLQSCVFAS